MKTEAVSEAEVDKILGAAKSGGYLGVATTFLDENLKQVDEHPKYGYFVVENYYGYGIYRIENMRLVSEVCYDFL